MEDELTPEAASRAALKLFRARYEPDPTADEDHLTAGAGVRVFRLDQPGHAYYLVPVLDPTGLHGILQLDAKTGEEQSSARVRDPASAFLLSGAEALAAVRREHPSERGWGKPYLGWRPSKESFDAMRPFWVVPRGNRTLYVDQSARVFEALTASGRGG